MKDLKSARLLKIAIATVFCLGLAICLVHFGLADVIKTFASGLKQLVQTNGENPTSLIASRQGLDREIVNELKLERISSSGGLDDLNSTDRYIEESAAVQAGIELQPGQVSYYQAYVTPNDPAVQTVARGKSYEEIYKEAVSWVWVEDTILNNVQEKWLSPNYFLTQSPILASNPVKGAVASDCEEQAYTLVSVLRAAGMPAEQVRVTTGKVSINGSAGGHAWVEVFDQATNSWFQLDATSGSYYDSAGTMYHKSSGLPYAFFKTYQYPSMEIWTYFNDKYFWDNNRQQGAVAENWLTTETVSKQVSQSQIVYELPNNIRCMREERIKVLQKEIKSLSDQELINQLEQLRRSGEQEGSQTGQSKKYSNNDSEKSQGVTTNRQEGPVVVVGKIDKVNSDVIIMSTRFGLLEVTYSADTPVSGVSPGGASTIERGLTILVEGEVTGKNIIQAKTIRIISK